MNSPAHAAMYI